MKPQTRPRLDSRSGRFFSSRSKPLEVYRKSIYGVMLEACTTLGGFGDMPVRVTVACQFARPPSHCTKGGLLTKSAPLYPRQNKGDWDNLGKPITDEAENARLLSDDSQIVDGRVVKAWGHQHDMLHVLFEQGLPNIPHEILEAMG